MIFEAIVIENPTKEQKNNDTLEELVLGPKIIIAKDANAAALSVVLDSAAALISRDRSRLEVLIRPFQ